MRTTTLFVCEWAEVIVAIVVIVMALISVYGIEQEPLSKLSPYPLLEGEIG